MRPVFCGNLDNDTSHSDLDRLFSKYGRVDRIDMKFGYAFIYFDDERDAEDAIYRLDGIPFGYSRRKLSVEWSRGERGRERDGSRPATNTKPTRTLFVINFDPIRTRDRDLERHFEPYGTITNIRIRRNFAFIQFKTQEEATKALDNTNMSKILDRMVTVEYAFRDDDAGDYDPRDSPRRGGGGGGGGYGRHEARSYGRSDSPVYRRGRPSPDYSRARSPVYDRYDGPSYGRSRSPEYGRSRR
ncbi:serine/arginine-rich splicing factor RS31-like isoform X3 [Curcuma longa]|uniref:serine/arginine-rich splicing factor RS31-like isoform X3 n=1 Tax=Curcuma longa TaxID=136217 RepID=UPI003D9E019F